MVIRASHLQLPLAAPLVLAAGVAWAGSTAKETSLISLADDGERPQIAEPGDKEPMQEELGEAIRIEKKATELGIKATYVLTDKNSPEEERAIAAKIIGFIRHTKSIDLLIENIDLKSNEVIGARSLLTGYPCAGALFMFGGQEVPHLVKRIGIQVGKENEKETVRLCYDVLFAGHHYHDARTYAKGLLQETKDAEPRKRLQDLIKQLDEWIAADKTKQSPGAPSKKPASPSK